MGKLSIWHILHFKKKTGSYTDNVYANVILNRATSGWFFSAPAISRTVSI